MGRLAVVLGSNALGPGGERIAAAAAEHGAAIVQRHGGPQESYVLPHEIDHEANLRPLVEQGCDRVLAIGSVGSVDPALPVGELICPDDFIALGGGGSIFADERAHSAPAFEARWRAEVLAAWSDGGNAPRDGGVYWQTRGPRFETPAEIRLIAAHADVIGMTIAAESIIAREMGIPYAAVCVVDNLANGIAAEQLSVAEFEAGKEENRSRLTAALGVVAAELERGGAG